MDIVRHTILQLTDVVGANTGVTNSALDAVESTLGVTLPADARAIARVFGGGWLSNLMHFPWSVDAPNGVVEQTRRLWSHGLPPRYVALGTMNRRLVAFDTTPGAQHVDSIRLETEEPLALPTPFKKSSIRYVAYFTYARLILDGVETEKYRPVRADLDRRYKPWTRNAARHWRHRWAPHEVTRIVEDLWRGIRRDQYPTVEHDGRAYTDLRGLVVPQPTGITSEPPEKMRLTDVDLSFAEGALDFLDARNCLFRAARMSSILSRFDHCDFTMADVSGASRKTLGEEFVDCSFIGAYLADVSLQGPFDRCDFTGADLCMSLSPPSAFTSCTWKQCRFGGDADYWDPLRESAWGTG